MRGKCMEHTVKCWYPIMYPDIQYAVQQYYESLKGNVNVWSLTVELKDEL